VLRFGLLVAGAVMLLDQLTKAAVLAVFGGADGGVAVAPSFNLVLVWNRGVSFGMLGGGAVPAWLFAAVSLIVVCALAVWLRRAEGRLTALSLGLVIGGAVGNIIDRLRFGAVVDFLDFYVGRYHWPAFNVADAAITVGVGLLILDALLDDREGRKRAAKRE
jgi:signal peptidase II